MIRYNLEGRQNHSAPSIRRTIYWKAKGWTQTGLTFESRKMRINIIKPAVSVALHICTCQGSSYMWSSNQFVLVVTPQENIFHWLLLQLDYSRTASCTIYDTISIRAIGDASGDFFFPPLNHLEYPGTDIWTEQTYLYGACFCGKLLRPILFRCARIQASENWWVLEGF